MYTVLNHLYKNTAAVAIAAFIVLGVGLTTTNNRSTTAVEANAPTSTLTISAGTGATWASTAAFARQTSSGGPATYGFISGNVTFAAGAATLAKSSTKTSRGYFQNTSTNYKYAKISSIAVTASSGGANLKMYLNNTAMTNITTPSANTVTATVVGSVYTFTPASTYIYFFLRNDSTSSTATVSQVVVTIVPILSSISVTTMPSTTTYDIGQNLNLTGVVVTGAYEDGATSAETGYTTTPATPYTFVSGDAGTKSISVSYTEFAATKTTSFNVTVRTQLQTDTISATNFANYIMGLSPGALCGAGNAATRSSMVSQYQALTSGAKAVFGTDPTMAAAKARYNYINSFYALGVPAAASNIPSITGEGGSFALILLISLAGLTSIGAYFLISKKRKEN